MVKNPSKNEGCDPDEARSESPRVKELLNKLDNACEMAQTTVTNNPTFFPLGHSKTASKEDPNSSAVGKKVKILAEAVSALKQEDLDKNINGVILRSLEKLFIQVRIILDELKNRNIVVEDVLGEKESMKPLFS